MKRGPCQVKSGKPFPLLPGILSSMGHHPVAFPDAGTALRTRDPAPGPRCVPQQAPSPSVGGLWTLAFSSLQEIEIRRFLRSTCGLSLNTVTEG